MILQLVVKYADKIQDFCFTKKVYCKADKFLKTIICVAFAFVAYSMICQLCQGFKNRSVAEWIERLLLKR